MPSSLIARIGYFNLIIGALSTLIIFFTRLDFKISAAIVIFIAWLLAPYFIIGWFFKIGVKNKNEVLSDCIASFFSVAVAIYALIDINYIHPDPQGAIAMLFVPIAQGIVFISLKLLLSIFVKNEARS